MQIPIFTRNPLYRTLAPVVLGFVYFGLVAPVALTLKILGKDPLHRRLKPETSSYWIERKPPGPAPATMKNRF